MPIIRVGFILGQIGWMGGVNYFRNLFAVIHNAENSTIQPVVFVGMKANVSEFEGIVEIIRTPILDRNTLMWYISMFLGRIFPRRDYLLYWILRYHKINIISHFGVLWRGCSIPSVGWIPDFQHLHLPGFCDNKELIARNKQFLSVIAKSDAVLLSSQDALSDLNRFYPNDVKSAYVLHFSTFIQSNNIQIPGYNELASRYGLTQPWFHIPNQFWAHKNHSVVLEALHFLKTSNQMSNLLVIATGNTTDYRNLNYYPTLIKKVSDYGLQANFRSLGVLPYSDVIGLMIHSIAIINPSLFEGWSTSVEEAKALGKHVILSDINVHREQNPSRGEYFDANDYQELSRIMHSAANKYDVELDAMCQKISQFEHIKNCKEFAVQYEYIISQVIEN